MDIGSSVSVQRISASTMKVVGVISLVLACVAARGSGPYLPSGWKPDGPSFYLPSEVSKPLKEPVKEVIFSESEASGSDFLREYGPPKVQEVSQDISQQGLPDVVNDQLFIATLVETDATKENYNVVTEITEGKLEVKSEAKTAEDPVTVSEIVTATESVLIEKKSLQLQDETTTSANVIESVDAIDEFGYIVEPTVAIVPLEEVNVEANEQSGSQIITNTVTETHTFATEQQESGQSVSQGEDSENADTIQVTSEVEQSSIDVSEQSKLSGVETSARSIQKAEFDVISTVEEKEQAVISTLEEKVESVAEEVKKVEEVVQNIPEIIVSLEKEVKSEQTEAIQEVPAIVKEIFGSVDEAPEGFLEYGPPGFTEYGPPREDLTDSTIEGKIAEAQSIIDNFVRRRRFSPKFRSFRKSH